MFICVCNRLSEKQIQEVIKNCNTCEEVFKYCNSTIRCARCVQEIQELLEEKTEKKNLTEAE